MRVFRRLVATVSVATYLCAAFTPCPSAEAMNSIARIADRSPIISVAAGHAEHASHASSAASPGSGGDHGARDPNDHITDVAKASERTDTNFALAWMPTCLCGCSETRGWIGGGTARLGPVIPVAAGAHPMPMIAVTAAIIAFSLSTAPASIADPIPT